MAVHGVAGGPRAPQATRSRAQPQAVPCACSSSQHHRLRHVAPCAATTAAALTPARRNLRTALVEREDFASGTSSKSTKMVHGGVRYLEKAVFNLVRGW